MFFLLVDSVFAIIGNSVSIIAIKSSFDAYV